MLEHISIEPEITADACLIWLHGLGADGHDFEPIVPELGLSDIAIRYIFPHAPIRPVSINNGDEMRAWYDFQFHSERGSSVDVQASADQIRLIIDQQLDAGIQSHRIILAGFSQGGVIALHTALRLQHRLAGVIAISTYLHDPQGLETERHDENLALPIFMGHGQGDPMIPIMRAATARENLIRLGYDVTWQDYPMAHQVCLEEIEDIAIFIRRIL